MSFWMKLAFLILFLPVLAFGYIPRSQFILSELATNSGSGLYQVEQDVIFTTETETFAIRETWWIENESSLRVVISRGKDPNDQILASFSYGPQKRLSGESSKTLNPEFYERYFHVRSAQEWGDLLTQMNVTPRGFLNQKPTRTSKGIEYKPETDYLRLSRATGIIAYAFGEPSVQQNLKPGIWVEQDTFVLRKIRTPSGAEITAENFSTYTRGLEFPKTRTVRWEDKLVTIQTLNVSPLRKEIFQKFSLKPKNVWTGLENHPAKAVVEDFYNRFR